MSQDEGAPRRRVRVDVPEHYKRQVRDDVWEELEKYVFEGFLTSQAIVIGRSFVFKTLNHHELRNIGFMKPYMSSPPESRAAFRAAFMAHSIVMVDGMNALHNRPAHIQRLVRTMRKVPAAMQEKIIDNLAAMNSRVAALHDLIEVYVHEPRSRFRWLQLQSFPVHSPLATGIPGTEELGMNHCQGSWTALNRILDKKDEMEQHWANSKFVGSCFNSKGVKAIDEKDRSRREKERVEIEDLKMKVLYAYLNRVPGQEAPDTTELPDGRRAVVESRSRADTVEALADQLSAALSGEKDHHDLMIEAKIRQLREHGQQIEVQMRQLYAAPPDPGRAIGTPATSSSRVLGGKAEAEALLARIEAFRREQAQKTLRMVSPDLQDSDGSLIEEAPDGQ